MNRWLASWILLAAVGLMQAAELSSKGPALNFALKNKQA